MQALNKAALQKELSLPERPDVSDPCCVLTPHADDTLCVRWPARAWAHDRPANVQVPLIGFIGRLDYQKGADLVLGAAPWLMDQEVQLVCLGTGDVSLEVRCSGCARQGVTVQGAVKHLTSLPAATSVACLHSPGCGGWRTRTPTRRAAGWASTSP